jgi:hypothetical protein
MLSRFSDGFLFSIIMTIFFDFAGQAASKMPSARRTILSSRTQIAQNAQMADKRRQYSNSIPQYQMGINASCRSFIQQ